MCGRFVVASSPALLAERFGVGEIDIDAAEPDYNVAPRAQVMVVRQRGEERVLSRARWGLVPSWAKDPSIGDRMINARADGLATKPAFKRAFAKRRCIIPADGFYEWKVVAPPTTPKGRPRKQPMFIHRRDGEPLAFAGLWEMWKLPEGGQGDATASSRGPGIPERSERSIEGGWLRSCVIVTTEPNALLAPVHDRMPVVLPESAWERWLDPEDHDVDALAELLLPAPDDWFELWPVAPLVNTAANNGPELVLPVPATAVAS